MTSDLPLAASTATPGLPRPRSELARTRSELQAIRDGDGTPIGYELFYRGSEAATAAAERTTAATLNVLAGLTGASVLSRPGHQAGTHLYFVNITRDFIVGAAPLPDPTEVAVLEIQPNVVADSEVARGTEELRARGYGVALDRFRPGRQSQHETLLPLASHVKLDVDGDGEAVLREAARLVREHSNGLLIGCRIGSQRGLQLARELGCDLFQGHALDKTGRQRQRTLRGSVTAYVQLLQLLAADDNQVDVARVSQTVRSDPDLSLRVLRACNAATTVTAGRITSIHQAVVLLGITRMRRSVHLAVAQGLAVDGDAQLLTMIEYASLADLVGIELGVPPGTGFLAGLLLETADSLGASIDHLVRDLPLDQRLAADLRDRTGAVGKTLKTIEDYKRGGDHLTGVVRDMASLHARAMVAAAELTSHVNITHGPAPVRPDLPPVRQPATPAHHPGLTDDLSAILGPAPSADEVVRAQRWHAWSRERSRRCFRDGSVPLSDLPARIGMDYAHLAGLADAGTLAYDDIEGILHVPLWQFTEEGQLLDGVDEIVHHFPGDAVALTEWITSPCLGLQRRVPLALLLQGRTATVISLVQAMASW